MIVYKVTKKLNGRNVSSIACELPSEWICEYEIGKVTLPSIKDSMLFAFLSKQDAINFACANQCVDIFKCETPFVIRKIEPQYLKKNVILEFWKNLKDIRNKKQGIKIAKSGTDSIMSPKSYPSCVCCPSILPVEKIQ